MSRTSRISPAIISECLAPFHAPLPAHPLEQIRTYVEILQKWNRKISLTTVTDTREVLGRHFGESIFGHKHEGFLTGRLADVGSGPGFPGLPLKIVSPGASVRLIEPNNKKCVFLAEVVRELGLHDVEVVPRRFEEVPQVAPMQFDAITARALGGLLPLLGWARSHLTETGKLLLWVGKGDAEEISSVPGWKWAAPLPIPQSDRRFLLAGTPQRE